VLVRPGGRRRGGLAWRGLLVAAGLAAGVGGVRLERPEPVTQERARTYELDADEPAGILGREEPRAVWVGRSGRVPGRVGLSQRSPAGALAVGEVSQAPIRHPAGAGRHDRGSGDRGLLSQVIERGLSACSCGVASSPGAW